MNFQDLKKVENYQFYLDLAFRRGREAGKKMRDETLKGGRLEKSTYIELRKMQSITQTISARMDAIIKSFPSFDQLPDFYKELVKLQIDYVQLKKSLGAVNWLAKRSSEFYRIYHSKLNKNKIFENINILSNEFLGRLSSMVKQIRYDLEFLEETRKVMKEFPTIKTSMKTVALVGFPNVGKTTLLYKLTGSKPEINSYPFTTKGVNVAYFTLNDKKIQLLDTPGALDRFEKLNNIEKIAYLAIKYCSEQLVYVFDLTEEYPIENQLQFYNRLKKDFSKPIIIFLSKVDLLEQKIVNSFMDKYPATIIDIEELKKKIL
jgi:nucleolar GTP-binding protein